MKQNLLSTLLALLLLLLSAQSTNAQYFKWARQIHGNATVRPETVATDPWGNVISVGGFEGTMVINPGTGAVNVTSVAVNFNSYIQKFDSNGAFLWGGSIVGNDNNAPLSVQVDAAGNIYVLGTIVHSADFDMGVGVNTQGVTDYGAYLLRLDPAGNLHWAKCIDHVQFQYEGCDMMAMDASANIYIAGFFTGTADLVFGPGVQNINSIGAETDPFLPSMVVRGIFCGQKGSEQTFKNMRLELRWMHRAWMWWVGLGGLSILILGLGMLRLRMQVVHSICLLRAIP